MALSSARSRSRSGSVRASSTSSARRGGGAGGLPRLLVRGQQARRLPELLAAGGQSDPLAELERQRPPGRAQSLVNAGEHAAEGPDAVGGEQAEPLPVVVGAEVGQGLLERLALEHPRLRVVEDAEARVDAGGEGM